MQGRRGSVGIGRETTWGTGVAPTLFFDGTFDFEEDRGRIRESMMFGQLTESIADAGRLRMNNRPINDIHARPQVLGELLRAALGVETSVSGADPYTHVWDLVHKALWSPAAPLPAYSVQAKHTDAHILRYPGGQLGQIAGRQEVDGALMLNTQWLLKGSGAIADTPMVKDTGSRYLYRMLAIQRAATAYPNARNVIWTLNNNLQPDETLNGSDEISAVDQGDNLSLTLEMTLDFREVTTYQDFKNNTHTAWEFLWTLDASNEFGISIPKMNIEGWGAPVQTPGQLSVRVRARAQHDPVTGRSARFTLKNAVATYA